MLVNDRTAFSSNIYSAIVVNTNVSDDPENKGRVQIYIPSIQYMSADIYSEYMSSDNKRSNPNFDKFPWATTLTTGLNLGDTIYGGYIDNDSNKYIILGKESNTLNAFNINSLNTSALMDLVMPIIMRNEVGCSLDAWVNDTISDEYYTKITLHDGVSNGWAIGLIQWNGGRAYSTLYECVKGCGENWEKEFPKLNILYLALKKSLLKGSPNAESPAFSANYNPDVGSAIYNAIKTVLGYKKSKEIQKSLAVRDTADTIDMLKEKGINNPAILIYLTDLMNQYDTGLPETIEEAVTACGRTDLNIMQQLDYLIDTKIKTFATYYEYKGRRDRTYDYIKTLYESGKFTATTLTDINGNPILNVVCGNGQYSMPFEGKYQVTATFGRYTDRNKPEYAGQEMGGYHGDMKATFHHGVDFGMVTGTPLYACTEGSVTFATQSGGAGNYACIHADDGNYILYMHMQRFNGSNRRVNKGDLLGYSDNTGHSFGAHLHFEIRVGGSTSAYAVNPFPFIGYEGNDRYYGQYLGS